MKEVIEDVNNITKKLDNFLSNKETAELKVNILEKKMSDMQTFLARPESEKLYDARYKDDFNDYIRKGNETQLIQKSFSGKDDEGGVLLIPTLYDKIISEINALSPMRQLASVETISSNSLDIIIEDGKFTSGWVGDSDARPDTNSPKLKQHRIFVHELYAQPKASQALIDDSAIQIENWLLEKIKHSFVKAENEAFILGDGKKKPMGILSRIDKVKPLKVEGKLSPEVLLNLINSLDERYLANATFLMNRTTLSEVQKLQYNDGRFIWQQSLSDSIKQTIFGISVVCCAEMPGIAKDKPAIILADFKEAYKIVDRSGISIMRDPYTEKPFTKFYTVKRVGGDVVDLDALKIAVF